MSTTTITDDELEATKKKLRKLRRLKRRNSYGEFALDKGKQWRVTSVSQGGKPTEVHVDEEWWGELHYLLRQALPEPTLFHLLGER